MANWTTPVFNRTQADVDYAISKIAEWRDTDSIYVTELKGCLNVTDINRIENNTRYLSDSLSALYYFSHIRTMSWDNKGLPSMLDISQIINNIREIISSYFQDSAAPNLPETMLTYEQINNIEKNLYYIKCILDNMISSFKECNTFECGEG